MELEGKWGLIMRGPKSVGEKKKIKKTQSKFMEGKGGEKSKVAGGLRMPVWVVRNKGVSPMKHRDTLPVNPCQSTARKGKAGEKASNKEIEKDY